MHHGEETLKMTFHVSVDGAGGKGGRTRRNLLGGGLALVALTMLGGCGSSQPAGDAAHAPTEAAKKEFNIGWSIYAGWMPWAYAEKSGILQEMGR